ncbi:MAG: sigma factor [Pseudomonadota bacterium]
MLDGTPNNNNSEAKTAASIVNRILEGSKAAEGEMVQRYERGLKLMLLHRAGDAALADDVSQETWSLIIRKIRDGELRDHTKLAAFIVQTGKNLLLMEYRNRSKYQTVDYADIDLVDTGTSNADTEIEEQELASTVRQLLSEMSIDRDRDLLYRFYIREESKDTLCSEYEMSQLHFNRVLHRARRRFRALLASRTNLGGLLE